VTEVNEHIKRKHWEPVLKSDLQENTVILPAIWSMKRKRRIDTREVYKWKSRLKIGGHKIIKGFYSYRDNIEDQINGFKAIFDIEVQGNLQDYFGIRIERKSDNSIHMTQQHLIASILDD
jgi:single-stranded DNA-specific DHH superfamily exonuclease